MKSPSLILRVSHLIIIQIIFIFTAIALVLYSPLGEDTIIQKWSVRNNKVLAEGHDVCSLLAADPVEVSLNAKTIGTINEYLKKTQLITHIDLLYRDARAGRNQLMHISSTIDDESMLDDPVFLDFYKPLLNYLSSSSRPYITLISDDNRSINYILRPENLEGDILLLLSTKNDIHLTANDNIAYIFLILFLISTLISLLIVNLMHKGIRQPVENLIKGLEKAAVGELVRIEESGDRQIRKVIAAFNEMTVRLAGKQEEVENANQKLVKINKNLAESEAILTSLVDYSPEAIVVTDLDDKVIIYNHEAAKDFGFNQTDMLGEDIGRYIPISDSIYSETVGDSPSGKAQEIICRRRDGAKFPALLVRTPLGLEGHRPMAVLYFVKNITESANFQQMILRLDRIASKGKMARSIAHEINNYLAILQGNLELVPVYITRNEVEKLESNVEIMRNTVARISNFTEGLSRFSDENSDFEKEDLNQLIENLVAFLKPQNKFDFVEIKTTLADNLPLAEIDSGQIQLVLVNLINNAAEAQEDSQTDSWVQIATHYDESSRHIVIRVSDNGPGVDEKYHEDLFKKRFSTKSGGYGLGLITSMNIINNHMGSISYSSGDGSQSIFEVKIPSKRPTSVESEPAMKSRNPSTSQ